MNVLCGLGNPGLTYQETRHNLGFRVIETLAYRYKIHLKKGVGKYQIARTTEEFLLVKPLTYMNRSGLAVLEVLQRFNLTPENLLVICDDCDLPFGRIRLRKEGSAGGHHGLESIIEHLSTEEFPRIRIGIGKSEDEPLEKYVLSEYSSLEKKELEGILKRAADAVLLFIDEEIEKVMSIVNDPNY